MPKGKGRPQVHAWTLSGAPANWDAQDVLRCVGEVGVADAEILKPPGSKKGWLVNGIVKRLLRLGVLTKGLCCKESLVA